MDKEKRESQFLVFFVFLFIVKKISSFVLIERIVGRLFLFEVA